MLAKRYGTRIQSVEPNFDYRAMTEVSFLKTSALVATWEEFLASHERVGERMLTAESEGPVKDEAEQQMLDVLESRITALREELGPGQVLVVENEAGQDYPKTRDRTNTLVVAGENKLYFRWTVDPPLRLGIYRQKS